MADHHTRSTNQPCPIQDQAKADPISGGSISGTHQVALEIRHLIAQNAIAIRLSTRATKPELYQNNSLPPQHSSADTISSIPVAHLQPPSHHIQLIPLSPHAPSTTPFTTPYQPFRTQTSPVDAETNSPLTRHANAPESVPERISLDSHTISSATPSSATPSSATPSSATPSSATSNSVTHSPVTHNTPVPSSQPSQETSEALPSPQSSTPSQSPQVSTERNQIASPNSTVAGASQQEENLVKGPRQTEANHTDNTSSNHTDKVRDALLQLLKPHGDVPQSLQSEISIKPPERSSSVDPSRAREQGGQPEATLRETRPEYPRHSQVDFSHGERTTTPESAPNQAESRVTPSPIKRVDVEPIVQVVEPIQLREATVHPNVELRLTPESLRHTDHTHTKPENTSPPSSELNNDTHRPLPRDELTSRVERLQDIQQIVAAERAPSTPVSPENRPDQELRLTPPPRHTSIHSDRIRESIIDRLSDLQTYLTPRLPETSQREHIRASTDTSIQGRDITTRLEPARLDVKRPPTSSLADRFRQSEQPAPTTREPLVGLASAFKGESARTSNADSMSPRADFSRKSSSLVSPGATKNLDRTSNLLELLKRFSERSVNFKLLNAMDTSIEKACLTVATGAALGFVGVSLLYRATNLIVVHTLRALRECESEETELNADDEQRALEKKLEEDLEDFTGAELSTFGEKGFVVDLAGIVVDSNSDRPLAGVIVGCSEYGDCLTDSEGRFIFSNIPLGTPYTITVQSPTRKLRPLVVTGVCGELEFLRIKAEIV